jgi:hypothetical protein
MVPKGESVGRSCGAADSPRRKCKILHFMSKICNIPLGQNPAVASHCIARIVPSIMDGRAVERCKNGSPRDIESVRSRQPSPPPNREDSGREATEARQRQVHKVGATLGNLAAVSAVSSVPVVAPLLAVVSVAAPVVSGAERENEGSGCCLAQKGAAANLSVDRGLANSARG